MFLPMAEAVADGCFSMVVSLPVLGLVPARGNLEDGLRGEEALAEPRRRQRSRECVNDAGGLAVCGLRGLIAAEAVEGPAEGRLRYPMLARCPHLLSERDGALEGVGRL